MVNIALLSKMVKWAAEDHVIMTDHRRAVELGLVSAESQPRNAVPTENGGWEQGSWAAAERNGVCQTSFCIAGHAVAQSPKYLVVMTMAERFIDSEGKERRSYLSEYAVRADTFDSVLTVLPPTMEIDKQKGFVWLEHAVYDLPWEVRTAMLDGQYSMSDAGRLELDLSVTDADTLFAGSNEIEDVVSYAVAIADREGLTLDVPDWILDDFALDYKIEEFNDRYEYEDEDEYYEDEDEGILL